MANKLIVDKIKALYISILILFSVIIIQTILMLVYEQFAVLITGNKVEYGDVSRVGFYVLYSIVGIIVFGIAYKNVKSTSWPIKAACGIKRYVGLVIMGIGMQGLVYGILNAIYELYKDSEILKSYSELIKNVDGSLNPSILIYSFFFAPIIEELIFRGVILENCRRAYSRFAACVIQAALFGVYHANLVQGIYAFVLGLGLGYIYTQRNNIIESIMVHIIVNISGICIVPILSIVLANYLGALGAYIIMSILAMVICGIWLYTQRKHELKLDYLRLR